MKTGMSKFTRVCLLTALTTFIIGCLLCGVGALFGGLRQLETSDIEGLTGIPFRITRHDGGSVEFGFIDPDLDDLDDFYWVSYETWSRLDDGGEAVLDLTADTLHGLYMELGACELYIEEAPVDRVSLKVDGTTKYFRYLVEKDGTLRLAHRSGNGIWNWRKRTIHTATKVYLYLPADAMTDYVNIELGAGSVESIGLQTREFDLDVGAGTCSMEALSAQEADITIGAGKVTIGQLEAQELSMEVGAGEVYIADALVQREAYVENGMGQTELNGRFLGDLDVECSMGNVTMHLDDAEDDHNYEIDCSLGNVHLGKHSYTGMADEVSIDNHSSSTYEIECSMGNVLLDFAK